MLLDILNLLQLKYYFKSNKCYHITIISIIVTWMEEDKQVSYFFSVFFLLLLALQKKFFYLLTILVNIVFVCLALVRSHTYLLFFWKCSCIWCLFLFNYYSNSLFNIIIFIFVEFLFKSYSLTEEFKRFYPKLDVYQLFYAFKGPIPMAWFFGRFKMQLCFC